MGHWAKVEGGIVTNVIVADDDWSDESDGWIQTSYQTRGGKHYDDGSPQVEDSKPALRKNFAGIGHIYDEIRDAFYEPQTFPSWVLNEDTCQWNPPVPMPDDGKRYGWDEENTEWKEICVMNVAWHGILID